MKTLLFAIRGCHDRRQLFLLCALILLTAQTRAAITTSPGNGPGQYSSAATAYFARQPSVVDPDARERVDGYFKEIDKAGLNSALVDGAFMDTDLNPSNRTFKANALGTNTLGVWRDSDGTHILYATNRWEAPITGMTSFSNTFIISAWMETNVAATTHSDFGIYNDDATSDYVMYYNNKLQSRYDTAFSDMGGTRDPWTQNGNVSQFSDSRERIVSWIFDNAQWRVSFEGMVAGNITSNAPTAVLSYPTRVVIGQRWTGAGYDLGTQIHVRQWALFNRVLSSNEVWGVIMAMRQAHPARENWVFLGDSTTASIDLRFDAEYPNQLMRYGNNRRNAFAINSAQSGILASALASSVSWRALEWKPYGRAQRTRVFLGAGINDIGGGASAATVFQSLTNIAGACRTNGLEVDVMTLSLINTNQATGWTAAMEATRNAYNALILADTNRGFFDRVWRKDRLFTLEMMDTNRVPKLCFDGLHHTAAGYALVANLFRNTSGLSLDALSGDGSAINNLNIADGRYPSQRTNVLLWSDNFNRASLGSSWATEGTGVAYITNSTTLAISTSGGGTGVSDVQYRNWFCGTAFWKITFTVTPQAVSGSSYGFSFGLRGAGNGTINGDELCAMDLFCASGGSEGTPLALYTQTYLSVDPAVAGVGSQLPSLTAGDSLYVEIERANHTWTMYVTNTTAGGAAWLTHVNPIDGSTTIGGDGNSGYPCFTCQGGTYWIDNVNFYATKPSPRWMFVGDSIMTGARVSNLNASFYNLIGEKLVGDYALQGNSQETLVAATNFVTEMNVLRPQNVVMMLGGNDVGRGTALTTIKYDYNYIVSNVTNVTFYHFTPTARSATDETQLAKFILTNGFPNVIDAFTLTRTNDIGQTKLTAKIDSGDGTHPNDLGHSMIADAALQIISKQPTNMVRNFVP